METEFHLKVGEFGQKKRNSGFIIFEKANLNPTVQNRKQIQHHCLDASVTHFCTELPVCQFFEISSLMLCHHYVGMEISQMRHSISRVKMNWSVKVFIHPGDLEAKQVKFTQPALP